MGNTAVRAGILYFLIVFAAGFLLGTFRVLLLTPRIGETAAVLVELPFIIGIAWITARELILRLGISSRVAARATLGGLGFALLVLAETLLGWLAFGRGIAAQVVAIETLPGALGLAGHIVFGFLPLIIRMTRR